MRILVTGGAGFLGSHLCDRLVAAGHDVVVIDNLQTGSKDNLVQFEGNRRIEFRQADIVNPLTGKYDRIYNLACPASPYQYQYNAIATARTNFYGVDNLLQLASQCGARFFQASTSEIYGDPAVHPQREDYFGTGPINLGNPNEFTMLELAKIIRDLTGSSSKLEFRELPQDDPKQRQPDIQLAKTALSWHPTISLRDGLLRTINYFEARLHLRPEKVSASAEF